MTGAERPEAGLSALRTRNRYSAAALMGCAVLVLAGCGSGDEGDEAKPSTPKSSASSPAPSKSPSSASPEQAAEQALLATYGQYWDGRVAAYAEASLKGSDLAEHAKGNALGRVQASVKNLQTLGQVIEGKPHHMNEPDADVDLSRKVPFARIKDCVDVSKWTVVDSKTKKPVQMPEGRRLKYQVDVTAERWGKKWVILEDKPQDKAC